MIILCELVGPAVDRIIWGVILFFVLFFLMVKVVVVVIRWIFRIREQIELLSQIRDELKKLNERKV